MKKSKTRSDLEYMGLNCLTEPFEYIIRERTTVVITLSSQEKADELESVLKKIHSKIKDQETDLLQLGVDNES